MSKSKLVKQFYRKYPFPNELKTADNYNWIFKGFDMEELRNKKILDIGCGTGDMTSLFSKYGDVTGIDFSEKSIEIAKNNYKNIRFIVDDVTSLVHNEKYDFIFCIGVLHHIPDIDKALENIIC